MPIYNQDVIIDKLNEYLKFKKRPIELERGYCHGFTLLWLYQMSIGEEDWFYNTITSIADCKNKRDFIRIESDIEKLFAHIEWLQRSDEYVTGVNHFDIEKLLEIPQNLLLSFLFTPKQFNKTLKKIICENKMICLSGSEHTIGLYRKNGNNYLRDPNDDDVNPRIINDMDLLATEIIACLTDHRNLRNRTIPLRINMASERVDSDIDEECYSMDVEASNKMEILDELIANTMDIDKPGYQGVTNLEFACLGGDDVAVERLLLNGANSNLVSEDDYLPLLLTAECGYGSCMKLLIKHGANPDLGDKNMITPLHQAARFGKEEAVEVLLKNGANPHPFTKDGETPLSLAVMKKHWDVAVTILAHSTQRGSGYVNAEDRNLLRKHRKEILAAATKINSRLNKIQKLKLEKSISNIYHPALLYGLFATKKIGDAIQKPRNLPGARAKRLMEKR